MCTGPCVSKWEWACLSSNAATQTQSRLLGLAPERRTQTCRNLGPDNPALCTSIFIIIIRQRPKAFKQSESLLHLRCCDTHQHLRLCPGPLGVAAAQPSARESRRHEQERERERERARERESCWRFSLILPWGPDITDERVWGFALSHANLVRRGFWPYDCPAASVKTPSNNQS